MQVRFQIMQWVLYSRVKSKYFAVEVCHMQVQVHECRIHYMKVTFCAYEMK
jgi:hypothetical protein